MFILWFVSIYTLVVLWMVLTHKFLSDYLDKYDENVLKKTTYWLHVIERCSVAKNYQMKKSELRKFYNPHYMSAFYQIQKEKEKEIGLLLDYNAMDLIKVMKKSKSVTEKAYFAYMLCEFSVDYSEQLVDYADLMLDFLIMDSVYLRENSLKVLYKLGKPELIDKAFARLSSKEISHSKKLLTDGLMLYTKDGRKLMTYLVEHIDGYEECYQVAIVNYMVYQDYHDCDEKLIEMLVISESVDLRCSILRLLGKKLCERHKAILLENIKLDAEESNWETAAVAAKLLGEYSGDNQVEEALEESIRAKNWYVRTNSAEAISRVYHSDEQVEDVLSGSDKYAAEALAYALEKQGE